MKLTTLILANFRHYLKSHLLVILGVAIGTAVLTGALIVGDSMIYSLQQSTHYRLGEITHSLTGGDRYFQVDLAERIRKADETKASAVLKLEGIASSNGGKLRLNKVAFLGVDAHFYQVSGAVIDSLVPKGKEVTVSQNTASRLNLSIGDLILLRIPKTGVIPSNAPFVSEEDQINTLRVKVKAIVGKDKMGRFGLQTSQTAPFNIFIDYRELAKSADLSGKANLLLFASEEPDDQLITKIVKRWTLGDAGFYLQASESTNSWSLNAERVFIEDHIIRSIVASSPKLKPHLSYFVNAFEANSKTTPYSFVTGLHKDLSDDEILINQWLSRDLNIREGDSLQLKYFEIGPLRKLTEVETSFKVKSVVKMQGVYADQQWMPDLPGLSDAGNCRDWNTGVPVDLEAIRDKDEKYWDDFKGTPKAFISQRKAELLWANRFGNATSVRVSRDDFSENELNNLLLQVLKPDLLGYKLNSVLNEGLFAANNGTDFGELFIGLSFFIIVAALILTAMLFLFGLEQRRNQIGTLLATGWPIKSVKGLFYYEGLWIALIGIIPGVFLAIGYNEIIFLALNQLWYDIVRTSVLEVSIQANTLLTGGLISLVISAATLWLTLRRLMKKSVHQLQQKTKRDSKTSRIIRPLTWLFIAMLILVPVLDLIHGGAINPGSFFLIGGLLLILFLFLFYLNFMGIKQKQNGHLSLNRLASKNRSVNTSRTMTQVSLLAIGAFLVISTGANRKDLFQSAHLKTSGTGGYQFVAQSTMPVLQDMNNPQWQVQEGIMEHFQTVSFRKAEGDDASCLNLNRISQPSILGVRPEDLKGRFSFATYTDDLNLDDPWKSLDMDLNGLIPAIADQTVIQWGLGKKVGDTLQYKNAKGELLNLKLIGGLAASVFQGNIIISDEAFLKNFTSSSGAQFFLIDADKEAAEAVSAELQQQFRDYGWEMTEAAQKLAEFKSVENTYLSIFLVLGGLGLIIGTFGFVVVVRRSFEERKSEIALLFSQGFEKNMIFRLISREVNGTFISGILAGSVTAVIATLPLLVQGGGSTLKMILLILVILLANGYVLIRWMIATALQKVNLNEALRNN